MKLTLLLLNLRFLLLHILTICFLSLPWITFSCFWFLSLHYLSLPGSFPVCGSGVKCSFIVLCLLSRVYCLVSLSVVQTGETAAPGGEGPSRLQHLWRRPRRCRASTGRGMHGCMVLPDGILTSHICCTSVAWHSRAKPQSCQYLVGHGGALVEFNWCLLTGGS